MVLVVEPATYGETNGSEATNDFFNGNLSKFGEKPSKPTPKPEHIDRFNQGNQKTKREALCTRTRYRPL